VENEQRQKGNAVPSSTQRIMRLSATPVGMTTLYCCDYLQLLQQLSVAIVKLV
jgi:hypothetical protein